ncbi:hypothetical protein PGT21_033478 [Puccinia graminis f. sp. tritici]|uniref:Uncharacterized protein n=1 Tax=Puccinia graminis f. sp. tritici TaxID=56615 RepID=A0A5B0R2X1_PUCGR|nr:hypothetical protein PGT21_033478 [Puccinia graminis f. sp. tritici]
MAEDNDHVQSSKLWISCDATVDCLFPIQTGQSNSLSIRPQFKGDILVGGERSQSRVKRFVRSYVKDVVVKKIASK